MYASIFYLHNPCHGVFYHSNIRTVIPLQEHSYSFDVSSAKDKVEKLEARLEITQKQRRNALAREKRAKLKCKDYIRELEEKNLLSAELQDKLSIYQGKMLNSLLVPIQFLKLLV